jgi:hypothetical protein
VQQETTNTLTPHRNFVRKITFGGPEVFIKKLRVYNTPAGSKTGFSR